MIINYSAIGPATVTKLQDAGFTSFASLLDRVEGISEVKGVSAALAEKIIAHLSDFSAINPDEFIPSSGLQYSCALVYWWYWMKN